MDLVAVLLLILVASAVGAFVLGVTLRHVPGPPALGLAVAAGVAVLIAGLSLLGVVVDPGETHRGAIAPGQVVQEVMDSLGGWSAAAVIVGLGIGLPLGFVAVDWLAKLE